MQKHFVWTLLHALAEFSQTKGMYNNTVLICFVSIQFPGDKSPSPEAPALVLYFFH